MILQSHISRKVKDKKYIKHVIVIPTETIKELGWKSGKKIKYNVIDGKLILS